MYECLYYYNIRLPTFPICLENTGIFYNMYKLPRFAGHMLVELKNRAIACREARFQTRIIQIYYLMTFCSMESI